MCQLWFWSLSRAECGAELVGAELHQFLSICPAAVGSVEIFFCSCSVAKSDSWDAGPDDAQGPSLSLLLVLRLSTGLLSPTLAAVCASRRYSRDGRVASSGGPRARAEGLGPPLPHGGSFCCSSVCRGSLTAAVPCSDLKQAPQSPSALES